MCYWVGTRKVREYFLEQSGKAVENEIAQLFYRTFIEPGKPQGKLDFNALPVAIGKAKPELSAIVNNNGMLAFKNLQWTLRWTYKDYKTGEVKEGRPLLNSTCEKVFWQHRQLIYTNRCVIPIDGYWEFYHQNGKSYPHFIYPKNEPIFYAGGIYNEFADTKTGEITECFSIITTPPNTVTKKLHNNPKAPNGPRMLLLLLPSDVKTYLDQNLTKDELKNQFFTPFNADEMAYHPTLSFLKKANSHLIHSPKIQEAFYYDGLAS